MKKKSPRGRKLQSDRVTVTPIFREEIDIDTLSRALIEIAIRLPVNDTETDKDTET